MPSFPAIARRRPPDGSSFQTPGRALKLILSPRARKSPRLTIGLSAVKQHMLVSGSTTPGTTTTDPIDTQPSGGALIVAIARGEWATGSPTAPTGNLGNTFALLAGPDAYADFPASKAAIYGAMSNIGGVGQTATMAWGAFSGTAQDEATISVIEILGNCTLLTSSHVERVSAAVITSSPVTTTDAALLMAFVWGTNNVGQLHTFTSTNGYTKIVPASAEGDPDPTGYIQCSVFFKYVDSPSTHTASFSGVATEGAQIYLLAFQGRDISAYAEGVGDTVTLSEALAALFSAAASPSETVSLAEAVAAGQALVAAAAETVTISEALAAVLGGVVGPVETVTLSEAVSVFAAFTTSLTETATLSESLVAGLLLTALLTETVTVSEALAGVFAAQAGIAETVTVSELLAVLRAAIAAIGETVSLAELAAVVLATTIAPQETVTLSEAAAAQAAFTSAPAETLTLAEAIQAQAAAVAALSEQVDLAESLAVLAAFGVSLDEVLALAELLGVSSSALVLVLVGLLTDPTALTGTLEDV